MEHRLIVENWRTFLSEESDPVLQAIDQESKESDQLVKKAKARLGDLDSEQAEALEQLLLQLPAVAVAALDLDATETNEGRGGRKGRLDKVRRQYAMEKLGLPLNTRRDSLTPQQLNTYKQHVKHWDQRAKQIDFMTTGAGGQASLLLTPISDLPLINKIPKAKEALMFLFQTDDVTLLGALRALSDLQSLVS